MTPGIANAALGPRVRRCAVFFLGLALLVPGTILAQDQLINSFEMAPGDISEWTEFNTATITDSFQGPCWRDGDDSGQLVIPNDVGIAGITLDASLEATPDPSNQYLAVDVCSGSGGTLRLAAFQGSWFPSTVTTFNSDTVVDGNDVLYLDLWDLGITAPTSIQIEGTEIGSARTFFLDNLRYTNDISVGSPPTETPTMTWTPGPPMSATFTESPSVTLTPTVTPTLTHSATYTLTPTVTPTLTHSATYTLTPTPSLTPVLALTQTYVAELTATATRTPTPLSAPSDGLTVGPSPFFPLRGECTRIVFETKSQPGSYVLRILTQDGDVVRVISAGVMKGEVESVCWPGRDKAGEIVSSGIYLVVLETPKETKTTKVVLIK